MTDYQTMPQINITTQLLILLVIYNEACDLKPIFIQFNTTFHQFYVNLTSIDRKKS